MIVGKMNRRKSDTDYDDSNQLFIKQDEIRKIFKVRLNKEID